MPQFNFANFLPQMAWLAVFFAILYFGIVRLTLPKVGRVMNEREETVSGDIRTAEAAKAEADRIEADYAASVAEARNQARERLGAARAHANKALEDKLAAANADIERRNEAAQAALAEARQRAAASIEAIAAEAAAEIVERLTGARPDQTSASRAVEAA